MSSDSDLSGLVGASANEATGDQLPSWSATRSVEPSPTDPAAPSEANEASPDNEPGPQRRWRRPFLLLVVLPIGLSIVAAYVIGFLNHRTPAGPDSMFGQPMSVDSSAVSDEPGDWAGGWGPERETFTMAHPATYAVLNSITDSRTYGDERNFVSVKNEKDGDAIFGDLAQGCPGEVVDLYFIFENAAADNLASKTATIHGLTFRIIKSREPGSSVTAGIVLTAKNARDVWDGATVHCSDSSIRLTYMPGTARLSTNLLPKEGLQISDSEIASGKAAIGSTGTDGELATGYIRNKYAGAGYVEMKFLVTEG